MPRGPMLSADARRGHGRGAARRYRGSGGAAAAPSRRSRWSGANAYVFPGGAVDDSDADAVLAARVSAGVDYARACLGKPDTRQHQRRRSANASRSRAPTSAAANCRPRSRPASVMRSTRAIAAWRTWPRKPRRFALDDLVYFAQLDDAAGAMSATRPRFFQRGVDERGPARPPSDGQQRRTRRPSFPPPTRRGAAATAAADPVPHGICSSNASATTRTSRARWQGDGRRHGVVVTPAATETIAPRSRRGPPQPRPHEDLG